ncbi:type II secretion system minor pseudopilin GspK [Pseudomonas vanderleydeniana]|uniref:Type II secretion system protein K n=1 Tax=Pseudomonas vanderleydeniana TaxID=2745495 RepID=A0A9E6PGZ3_9PSED|nr:type II secretion system minor pseudopilin GspK [Pseudomonas vanderleydeniana]QXI25913.1 type II secretion system minor pseudopilin GspK [Pseudomonas vanderleydeniana]
MKARSPRAAKQEGMAIISALLIAAVVAVIAAGMLSRETVFTRSLEAEQLRVQGSWQLRGGLELSRQVLWEARQRDPLTHQAQAWAQPIQSARGGRFDGRLEDEQGKFNLRNLVSDERIDAEQMEGFARLCEMIGVKSVVAQRIAQRVISSYPRLQNPERQASGALQGTFDSGRLTSPGAADKPLPATRPMLRSLDDLRSVDGVDDETLARLAPHVTILPANTWINGNTATAEVLASQVPGLSPQRARGLISERDSGQWFINRGDFVNRLRMPQLVVADIKVGITSEWFLLLGQARNDRRRVNLTALLHRSELDMPQVIWSRVGV